MSLKKGLKAYNFQKNLFPDNTSKSEVLTVISSKEIKPNESLNYNLVEYLEKPPVKYKINYEKLFWLLSVRIGFLIFFISIFFYIIF